MRLSESVDQKFWKNLRSKWPEPLEPTWKLTFKTPKYQEKVYWHHFDIKYCISWDFSYRKWFFSHRVFYFVLKLQTSADSFPFECEIQNKPPKKNSKLSVHTFNGLIFQKMAQLYQMSIIGCKILKIQFGSLRA